MNDIIKPGEKAPDFKLQDQNGEVISLRRYSGQKVLLSWHPLAWTSVCTDQMRSVDRAFKAFAEKNTVVDSDSHNGYWWVYR